MDPSDNHGRASASGGSHIGRNENHRSRYQRFIAGHGNGRTAVEPEPAEPEDEHAQAGQRQAVTGDSIDTAVFIVFADTGPQNPGTDEGADTADHVYARGAGEIMET